MQTIQPFSFKNIDGKQIQYLGKHALAEYFNCDTDILNNTDLIKQYMVEAVTKSGATVVETCFHKFNPYGVSGVVIIAESHFAIHTWPELNYASVDLYTCGEKCNPELSYQYLKEMLHAENSCYNELHRGFIDNNKKLLEVPFKIVN